MPAVVDHDERRDLIAQVTKEIISESGIKGVTIRNVARRAGFSATIISHYFRDKQHMLVFAYESVLRDADERARHVLDAGGDLMACFEVLLPFGKANLTDWQAWFGFWGTVTADPALVAVRLEGLEETQRMFRHILECAKATGELPANLDTAFHANRLQMMFNGLASLVLMSPESWPHDAQRDVLARQIDLMRKMPTARVALDEAGAPPRRHAPRRAQAVTDASGTSS